MSTRFLLVTLLVFAAGLLRAQSTGTVTVRPKLNAGLMSRPVSFDNQIMLLDQNNRAFNREFTDVSGSPFLFIDFKLARVVMAGGRKQDSVKLRLDAEKQELHYLSENTIYIINPGKVAEVEFIEPIPDLSPKFKAGYPKIDNQDEHSFYNLLAEGKVELLKMTRKKFVSTKNEMSGEIENRFDLYEDYYVTAKNEMKRLKKDRDFIMGLFADQKEKIDAYFSQKKPNLKNAGDLTALFTYYNSL